MALIRLVIMISTLFSNAFCLIKSCDFLINFLELESLSHSKRKGFKSTRTILSDQLKLDIPIISSAMDTVTESKMAIALAKQGGIGVIHRNLSISKQINEIKKVKSKSFKVGAAVGTNESELNRIKNILKLNIDLIVVDLYLIHI